jgi:hypothetical protein
MTDTQKPFINSRKKNPNAWRCATESSHRFMTSAAASSTSDLKLSIVRISSTTSYIYFYSKR